MRPIVIFALIALAAPAVAQAEPQVRTLQPGQAAAPATIAAVAWLEGRWIGEGMGGQAEETYAGPLQGQMVGHFRFVQNGKPVFYQFILIREAGGSLAYRLKHFGPDGNAWEEKADWVEFPLVAVEGDLAYFSGLTLERIGRDRMAAYLRMSDRKRGTSRIETFRFRKAR